MEGGAVEVRGPDSRGIGGLGGDLAMGQSVPPPRILGLVWDIAALQALN
jgi:hypothetical protein